MLRIAIGLIFMSGLQAALPSLASAQGAADYPAKPIRMIAGWPPGGGSDIIGRVVAQQMAQGLGQAVIMDNKSGAGNSIASDFVAKAAPDGYTLQFVNANHTLNAFVYSNLPYDTEKDFRGVSQVSSSALVLVTHPSFSARSVAELIAMAKAKPGTLNAAAGGTSGSGAVSIAIFKQLTGAPYVIVPYKGGADAMVALMRGEVQFSIISQASSMAAIKSGKVRLIGVLSKKRLAHLPDVPTLLEGGVQGLDLGPWEGVIAPAKTSTAIVNKVNAEILRALKSPEVIKVFTAQGVETVGSSPEEFDEHVRDQMALFRKVFKDGKIGN
jgi:tripartite-type tricarboxylate transporter receptor subunit TctC